MRKAFLKGNIKSCEAGCYLNSSKHAHIADGKEVQYLQLGPDDSVLQIQPGQVLHANNWELEEFRKLEADEETATERVAVKSVAV